MDLLPLAVSKRTNLDGKRKAKMVKKIHKSNHEHIGKKKNKDYTFKANKGW